MIVSNIKTEDLYKIIRESMDGYDCGDHGCLFAKDKSGQRTNVGCLCLDTQHGGRVARDILRLIVYNTRETEE